LRALNFSVGARKLGRSIAQFDLLHMMMYFFHSMDYMKKMEGPAVIFSSNFLSTKKQMFLAAHAKEPGGMWLR
jgi:hypothetical protein